MRSSHGKTRFSNFAFCGIILTSTFAPQLHHLCEHLTRVRHRHEESIHPRRLARTIEHFQLLETRNKKSFWAFSIHTHSLFRLLAVMSDVEDAAPVKGRRGGGDEEEDTKGGHRVRVAVRIRPFNRADHDDRQICLSVEENKITADNGSKSASFTYDFVFHMCGQSDVCRVVRVFPCVCEHLVRAFASVAPPCSKDLLP